LVEALAAGPASVLAVGGARGVVETARALGKPTWLVAGAGTRLPAVLWDGMRAALQLDTDWQAGLDVIDVARFTRVIGPSGASDDTTAALTPECPPTTELLRRSAI
jgi:hypothetical protein